MRYRRYTAVLCSGLGALHYRGADLQNHVHQGSSHPHGDRGWVGEPRKHHSRDSPSSAVPSWFECQLAMTPPLTGSQDAAVASLDSTHGRCCNQTCAETPSRDRPPLEQLLGYRMPRGTWECQHSVAQHSNYENWSLKCMVLCCHDLGSSALSLWLSQKMCFGICTCVAAAGLSTLWMGAGWNYYTFHSKQAADEPSVDTRCVGLGY